MRRPCRVNSAVFSPDGTRIASGGIDATVKVWDARTGQRLLTLQGPRRFVPFRGSWSANDLSPRGVMSVAYSPDGKHIVSGAADLNPTAHSNGEVKVWDAATGQHLLSLTGHPGQVSSVTYSPDGKRIASGGSDMMVRVWDAATGRQLLSLGHRELVSSVAYSPDASRIASAGNDGVKVWDAATGQNLSTLQDPARSVAYSPNGRRIASAGAGVRVWDIGTGQEPLTLTHTDAVHGVGFSPDARRIVSAGYDAVRVWDAATGQEVLSFPPGGSSVAYSPDGRHIVSGGTYRRLDPQTRTFQTSSEVTVWDAGTGKGLRSLKGHSGLVFSVAYSPDGRCIASVARDGLRVWNAATGQQLRLLHALGESGYMREAAFSPDSKRILSAYSEWNSEHRTTWGMVKVWDVDTGKELLTIKGPTVGVNSVAYSPDGSRIASGGGGVQVWDSVTGQHLLSFAPTTGAVVSVRYSSDGKRIITGGTNLNVWDAVTGQELLTLKGHRQGMRSVAYSPDGRRIASGAGGMEPITGSRGLKAWGEVKVWDAGPDREEFFLSGNSGFVVFSPDGNRIVGTSFGELKVWEAARGKECLSLKGHTGEVSSLAYSPDGRRIVSGSQDRTLKVWDAATGQNLHTLRHTGRVLRVAYSTTGKRIASVDSDHTVRVWDASRGQLQLTLTGHAVGLASGVNSVVFSPDGRHIASGAGGWDGQTRKPWGEVKVWDARTGRQLLSLKDHTGRVTQVAYSPDGMRIVSAGDGETVKVWDAATGREGRVLRFVRCTAAHARHLPNYQAVAPAIVNVCAQAVTKSKDTAGRERFTLKGHTRGVYSVAYSADGRRIVSGGHDSKVIVWDAVTGKQQRSLQGHAHPVAALAYSSDGKQLYSCDHCGNVLVWNAATGMLVSTVPAVSRAISAHLAPHGKRLAYRLPGDFYRLHLERILTPDEQQREDRAQVQRQARASREYHTAAAEAAEKDNQPFAAIFHLDRLLPLLPAERATMLARRWAVLRAALKKTPGDTWAAHALARQTVADRDTSADREALLAVVGTLAKQQYAPCDPLFGAVLLRAGSPREALRVLRAACKKRDPDGASVEELLLALAHAQLKQAGEAGERLDQTLRGRRDRQATRAAVLAGLGAAGPLAGLGSLVGTVPQPLTEAAAQELAALQAEVELTLGREYRLTSAPGPRLAQAHLNLGTVLLEKGNVDEASRCFKRAVALDHATTAVLHTRAAALLQQGQQLEVFGHIGNTELLFRAEQLYHKALVLAPKLANAHVSLGRVLHKQGKLAEAEKHCRKAIEFGTEDANAPNTLGIILLGQGKLAEAEKLYRRAIELAPTSAIIHDNLGVVLQRQGKWAEAEKYHRKTLELDPTVAKAQDKLAWAMEQQGKWAEALPLYTKLAQEPANTWARTRLPVVQRIVALEPKLPALRKGELRPGTTQERLDFALLCRTRRLYRTSAGLYADAFAADAKVGDDLKAAHRYNAACWAALAAAGKGEDAGKLDDQEKARLRKQALAWLQADLVLRTKQFQGGKPADRTEVQGLMRHWQNDTDLAGVRDRDALDRLPEAERQSWQKLWADVAALLGPTR